MSQLRLPLFTDCPYGGCEDGYCACLEQDLNDCPYDDCDPEMDDETRRRLHGLQTGRAVIYRGRYRPIETVHLPTYEPQGT